MKPMLQKLPLNQESSFVAKTFRTPDFEVGWHQHVEYELILFTEGNGVGCVGDHISEFETGDVYLLGSNLPHTFQKQDPNLVTSAVVVQFRDDFWGQELLNIPESRQVKQLLDNSAYGLKITGECKKRLSFLIKDLETARDFRRVLLLGECLEDIVVTGAYYKLSSQAITQLNKKDKECIDRIIEFTIENFKEPVKLSQVAKVACMSVPAFCKYFRRSTKKTYIDFLNEVRIGYACRLLTETKRPVVDICFASGYNTTVNFHKRFGKLKSMTPLQYRKHFDNATRQSPE